MLLSRGWQLARSLTALQTLRQFPNGLEAISLTAAAFEEVETSISRAANELSRWRPTQSSFVVRLYSSGAGIKDAASSTATDESARALSVDGNTTAADAPPVAMMDNREALEQWGRAMDEGGYLDARLYMPILCKHGMAL
jgi:hypothetical protein